MIITNPQQFIQEHGDAPQRIISLVPSQTELLCDLGLQEHLVGVTKFCVHPADIRKKAGIIGGTKNLRLETIKSLNPDLIIANKEENVQEQVRALAADFPVWVSDIEDIPSAIEMIRTVGLLCGRQSAADDMADSINSAFENLRISCSGYRQIRVLYCIWREPWMSVGRDTFIHQMLEMAGLVNVCSDKLRYPALEPSDLNELNPEYVLLSSEPYPFSEKHLSELAEILPSSKAQLVDGEYFSWYGSRMLAAVNYLENFRKTLV